MVGSSSTSVLSDMTHSLADLDLQGSISFESTNAYTSDFGNIHHDAPAAVLFPASVNDISTVVRHAACSPTLTVAARGHGHSIYGQAQALNGVVVDMPSLKRIEIYEGQEGKPPYADVSGGELWIDVLKVCLRRGYAPRTWPDYLYLSVGGTLQNAGVGGQTFRYGPVLSNVLQLEVVTGKGEVRICSPVLNSDLFFASLGGLGQFGIITKAQIVLGKAPQKVRWIRALYADLSVFTHDQELLISLPEEQTFDYLEGFVVPNYDDPLNGWGQVTFSPDQQIDANLIPENSGPVLYCLELAKHYNDDDEDTLEQVIDAMLRPLSFIPNLRFTNDVSYFDFLNRVSSLETFLRSQGLWESSHPWLCLFVPRSSVTQLDAVVIKEKLTKGVGGLMHMYPMLKSKWDERASVIIPNEDIFYLVSFLKLNVPPSNGFPVSTLLAENVEILQLSHAAGISFKVYMPHFTSPLECCMHFGSRWQHFVSLKQKFDPLGILSPGQHIFPRIQSVLPPTTNAKITSSTTHGCALIQDLNVAL